MSKISVAIIIPSLANMGPISVARDIVSNIINKVKYVKVFYFDSILELNFECETEKITFFEKIDFDKFDVVHTHGLRPDLYLTYHRPKKIRKVSTLHSNVFNDLIYLHGKTKGWLAAKIWVTMLSHHKIVVLSNKLKEYYKPIISNSDKRLETIYNGRESPLGSNYKLDISEQQSIEQLRSKVQIVVGVVSVLTKLKGVKQVIEALSQNEHIGALILGDGVDKEYLENYASLLKVSDRAVFLGYKNNPSFYHQFFDVFTLTSYSEGMPLGLLEAIQMKTPSVVSNLDIYQELFTPEEVITYELENIEDLVEKILFANANSESLTAKAMEKVRHNYTPQIMAERYLKTYEGLE